MRSFIAATALLQSFLHLAYAQTASNDSSSACPQQGGVHIIVARASLEPLGFGTTGTVKDAVLQAIPGSTAEFVVYPATLNDYINSETAGVLAARELINAYITNCPNQPLVVMGYSQGAQVTADSLVGQNVKNFPANDTVNQPLPDSTLSRVAAVIMMGDPTFVTQESFHVGNATKDSLFPRYNVPNFDATGLASRTQSYCDDGDTYCASGNNLIVHVSYVREYGMDAATYVVNGVAAWYASNGGSSSGPSSVTVAPKPSASSRAASGTASRSAPSASVTRSSVPVSPSSTPTSSSPASSSAPVSTGAAAALEITGAGIGAVAAGLFAFLL